MRLEKSLNTNQQALPLYSLNLLLHARDLSKKIKNAKHQQAKQGKFIGGQTPYGYQKDPDHKTYGYRRVWKWLQDRKVQRNPKTVLRVMQKYGMLSEIRRRRKWVNLGQQVHKYENLLNRQFKTDKPNTKWVTDISYIHTKEGVLYLSMIRDLYDNSIL